MMGEHPGLKVWRNSHSVKTGFFKVPKVLRLQGKVPRQGQRATIPKRPAMLQATIPSTIATISWPHYPTISTNIMLISLLVGPFLNLDVSEISHPTFPERFLMLLGRYAFFHKQLKNCNKWELWKLFWITSVCSLIWLGRFVQALPTNIQAMQISKACA